MKPPIFVHMSEAAYSALIAHLLRPNSELEQAAFGFAQHVTEDGNSVFRVLEWMPVPSGGFEVQLAYHFQLTDAMQARVIKRAHDLGACLVEFHCHTGPWRAAFSPSDRAGFREFVPHVLWRLKGKPYVAVVVCNSGRDGLAWAQSVRAPQRVAALRVGAEVLGCTALTPLSMESDL